MGAKAGNAVLMVMLYAAELGALAFLAWRNHIHPAVITVLAAGVVVTWFLPKSFTMLALGLALLGGAVLSQIVGVHSEIGYTAAVLTAVVGAVIALMEK